MLFRLLHSNTRSAIGDIIGKIDKKLCETTFRSCIIAEDGGEGGVSQRLGKALAQGLTRSAVITQATDS